MGVAERIRQPGAFDVDRFMAFIEHRPDEERWQLVDGVAQRRTPPTLIHQLVASNLQFVLEVCFRGGALKFRALAPCGLRIPGVRDFQPEPDLVVLPTGVTDGRWTENFVLVAEVLSRSNQVEEIARKVELYCSHPDNRHVLVIDKDTIRVTHRAHDAGWRPVELGEADRLTLPEFGLDVAIPELYRDTTLAPGS